MSDYISRAEHLQWAKDRALEYCDRGQLNDVWASFISDMSKHPETKAHPFLKIGMALKLSGNLGNPVEVRRFIEGFN